MTLTPGVHVCEYTHRHPHLQTPLMRAVLTAESFLTQAFMFRVNHSVLKFVHHSLPSSTSWVFRNPSGDSYFKRTNECRDLFILLKYDYCLESLEVTQLFEYNSF